MVDIISLPGETLISGVTEWKQDKLVDSQDLINVQNVKKIVVSGQIRTSIPNNAATLYFLINDVLLYRFDCNSDAYQTLSYELNNIQEFLFLKGMWRVDIRIVKVINVDVYLNNFTVIGE